MAYCVQEKLKILMQLLARSKHIRNELNERRGSEIRM